MTINPALADLTDTQLVTHLKGLRDRQAAETHPQGSAHFTALIEEVFIELGQRVAAQYTAEQDAIAKVQQAARDRSDDLLLARIRDEAAADRAAATAYSRITISPLDAPVHAGDWHDKPLRWEVKGPGAERQLFSTKADATLYARLRRSSPDAHTAGNRFVAA